MPRSFSSGYQERNRRLQIEAEARNRAAQRTTQAVYTALEKGAEIVNQLGTSIGNQQAAEYMQGLQTEIKKGIDDGSLMSAKDGSPLTADESIANYDNFIKGYREKNAEPSNPWAKAAINKSIDSIRQGNVERIITDSIHALNARIDNDNMRYLGIDENGNITNDGLIRAQIENPADYTETNMKMFNLSESDLPEEMMPYYNIAMGITQDNNIPADQASKMVLTYSKFISNGKTHYQAITAANNLKTTFAEETFVQNAAIGFSNNVINGNVGKEEYMSKLTDSLKSIREGNLMGFEGKLSDPYIDSVMAEARRRCEQLYTAEENRQADIWNNQMLPYFLDIEDEYGLVTSRIYNDAASKFGYNIKFADATLRTTIEKTLSENDLTSNAISVVNELNGIYGQSASASEKAASANAVFQKIDSDPALYARVMSYGTKGEYTGYFSVKSNAQMIAEKRLAFNYQPGLDEIKASSSSSSASIADGASNALPAWMTTPESRTVAANIILDHQNGGELPLITKQVDDVLRAEFVSGLSDEQRTQYDSERLIGEGEEAIPTGLDYIFEIDGDSGAVKSGFGSESAEAEYQRWKKTVYDDVWNGYMRYGNEKLDDGKTTMGQIVEDAQLEYDLDLLGEEKGFYQTGGIKKREQFAERNFNEMVATISIADPSQLPNIQSRYLLNKSRMFTEEDAKILNQYINGDFSNKMNERGLDLGAIISSAFPDIRKGDSLYATIASGISLEYKADILGNTPNEVLEANIKNSLNDMRTELLVGSSSQAIREIDSFAEDVNSVKDLRKIVPNDECTTLAGEYIYGTGSLLVTEAVDEMFTLGNDGMAIDFRSLIFSDEGVMYPDEDIDVMLYGRAVGYDYNPAREDRESALNNIGMIVDSFDDDFTKAATAKVYGTLKGLVQTAKSLTEDFDIEFDSFNGKYFTMNGYEIAPVIIGTSTTGMRMRAEGDAVWTDISNMSERSRDAIAAGIYKKARADAAAEATRQRYGYQKDTTSGTGIFYSVTPTKDRIQYYMDVNTLQSPEAMSIIEAYQALYGGDYRLVIDGKGGRFVPYRRENA